VARYQDVYPTKQQTGAELFELVHRASLGFQRVALYFESSLQEPDLKLLPSAAAAVSWMEVSGGKTLVESAAGVGVPWKGAAMMDGRAWPVADGETVWLPAGAHTLEAAPERVAPRLIRLNADLKTARISSPAVIEFSYQSTARAIAILDRAPLRIRIDGADARLSLAGPKTLMLPRGQHSVAVEAP
jgi:hypothetical protein